MKTGTSRVDRAGSKHRTKAHADSSPAAVLRALGDETRLQILERLAQAGDSLCVCDIECCFDLSQPTISHHVKVLRDAGLVTCERRGSWVHCAIDVNALERVTALLSRLTPRATKKGVRS